MQHIASHRVSLYGAISYRYMVSVCLYDRHTLGDPSGKVVWFLSERKTAFDKDVHVSEMTVYLYCCYHNDYYYIV